MSKFTLVPNCSVEDAPKLALNNVSAFWGATWWRSLWENQNTLEEVAEKVEKRTPNNLLRDRHIRRHQKAVDPATGKIVGYARWILPESHAGSWLEAQVPDVSEEERERYKKMLDEVSFKHRTDMDVLDPPVDVVKQRSQPKKPFIKLDYMCAHPDYQRHGVASMLLQSGMKKADELGLEIFLIAMGTKALGMYKKHNFELIEELTQSLEPWGYDDVYDTYMMIRQPVAKE